MKKNFNLTEYFLIGFICCGMSAVFAEDGNSNPEVEKNYQVEKFTVYPDSFYGRKFVHKTSGNEFVLVLADYKDPESITDMGPDAVITKNISDFLHCRKMNFQKPDEDELDGFMYDSDSFTGCETPEGRIYDGEAFVTGGFYGFYLYTPGLSEQEKELLGLYDWEFQIKLAAQDSPSIEFSQKNDGELPEGYVGLPTFSYPVTGMTYVNKMLVNSDTDKLFAYQIAAAGDDSAEMTVGALKDYCGKNVKIQTGSQKIEFSSCISNSLPSPIEVVGNAYIKDQLLVVVMHSKDASDEETKMFEGAVEKRLDSFDLNYFKKQMSQFK